MLAPPTWLLLHLHPQAGGWETQEDGCPRQMLAALAAHLVGFLTCHIPLHLPKREKNEPLAATASLVMCQGKGIFPDLDRGRSQLLLLFLSKGMQSFEL